MTSRDDVTLLDVAIVVHRRRMAFATALVLSLVAGGAAVVLTTPQYEASAAIVTLNQEHLIRSWLASREAAGLVVDELGPRLHTPLFGGRWDAGAQGWKGTPPTREEMAVELQRAVETRAGSTRDPSLTIVVRLPDAQVARDAAAAYVASLATLRPQLEKLARADLADRYYEAHATREPDDIETRAAKVAAEREYWVVFDEPVAPHAPVKPDLALYMGVALAAGLVAGLFSVFAVEWFSRNRQAFRRAEA